MPYTWQSVKRDLKVHPHHQVLCNFYLVRSCFTIYWCQHATKAGLDRKKAPDLGALVLNLISVALLSVTRLRRVLQPGLQVHAPARDIHYV